MSEEKIGLVADFCISKRLVWFMRRFGIFIYHRKRLRSYFKHYYEKGWKITDNKIIEFCKRKGYILLTRDKLMIEKAKEMGVRAIYIGPDSIWAQALKILHKLDSQYYYFWQIGIDLRLMVNINTPNYLLKDFKISKKDYKKRSFGDWTYEHLPWKHLPKGELIG